LIFGKARPNFAGEWIIHTCTCGTGCGYPFMWNARTGELYHDFPCGIISVGPPSTGWRGLIHTAASRLLVPKATSTLPRTITEHGFAASATIFGTGRASCSCTRPRYRLGRQTGIAGEADVSPAATAGPPEAHGTGGVLRFDTC
jgi:hypothetical protein